MIAFPPLTTPLSDQEILARAAKIKLVVFDVDGVLTDGSLYLGDDGQEIKAFFALDGHGIKMLKRSGVELAIITGRHSQLMRHRAKNLNIEHLYQGIEDKLEAYLDLTKRLGYSAEAPIAERLCTEVLSLPVHPGLSAADVGAIALDVSQSQ